jgi:triphosphoribosyl-dephospho-CoA synthetase
MVISKLKHTIYPDGHKMSVENAGCTSNPVPAGAECGDCHMAYLTARGKSVAVNFSTNILSRRDRKTARPCPDGYKMSVENAVKYTIYPAKDKMLVEKFSETFLLRAVRYGMSVENAGYTSNPVPSGTECGDCHMAYLTARGKSVAVNFSTNILSRRDRKNHYLLFISHY